MSDEEEYYENNDDYDQDDDGNDNNYADNDPEEYSDEDESEEEQPPSEDVENHDNNYQQYQPDSGDAYGYSGQSYQPYYGGYQQQQQPPSYDAEENMSRMQNLNLNEPETVTHQYGNDNSGSASSFNLGSVFTGALDGFGGGNMHDIINTISNITGGQGGLSNMMASGGLEAVASGLIANAVHQFFGINPETGRIIGAIAGNIIFHLGGKDNSLSNIGKIVLDNLISGKYHRKVDPFVPVTPGMPSFHLDFYAERDRCLRERRLFEDLEFPAVDSSLYYSHPPRKQIEWKRPGEIVSDPQLIISKQSRFDVIQGSLGDCWLLAATANLTLRDELFYRVVPPDQSFTENYAGIFHFQFWRYGKWVDVVIDDRLPTHNGELVYMHSAQHNEFWSALLEKAYAKLYGNYETLKGGSTAEAMEDFTGGLIEYFDLHEIPREQVLALLVRGFQMGALFGCSIDADPNITEAQMSNGLVRGHAYSITALQTVRGPQGETVILRIRNPWGEHEWNGAWSDSSPKWNYISPEQRTALGVSFNEDGEFWMSFDDFLHEFERMENCNLGPEVMDEINQMTGITSVDKSAWMNFVADGAWVTALGTAGGCKNNLESFSTNPQYLTSYVISENQAEQDGKVTVIVAVLQKYRRELRVQNLDSLSIGFYVFPNDSNSYGGNYYGSTSGYCFKKDKAFFVHTKSVAKSSSFIDLREVTVRFRVPPGSYVIVPSTFSLNEDAEFLLRVFTNGQINATELR